MLHINTKTKRLAKFFLIVAAVLLVLAMAGYSLFFKGYSSGIITKDSHKTGINQMICMHDWTDRTGTCMKCGMKCVHPKYDSNNNCTICGFHHIHDYEDYVCLTCGAECTHEHWSKGTCTDCGFVCSHEEWHDDICTKCGIYCTHPDYKEGMCVLCGSPCLHTEWENGICVDCKLQCDHVSHDPATGTCFNCGTVVFHDFTAGVCTCGLTPPFITSQLPAEILEEAEHKGTISTITYTTKKYNENNEIINKNMDVYLPYGYSTENKYNVLVLIHGTNGHYYDWSDNPITVGSNMTNIRNIYDNMIEKRLCRPLIIVSVSSMYYGDNGTTESGYKQLASEIRNDILPYIAEHYSTYAAGITPKALEKAREHFGIGGINTGASYAYSCGMAENFDLFSNFVCLSGCADPGRYETVINSDDNKELPIYCYFTGAGGNDSQRAAVYNGFNSIVSSTKRLNPSINAFYTEIQGAGYSWSSWTALTYNALLVLFPEARLEDTLSQEMY